MNQDVQRKLQDLRAIYQDPVDQRAISEMERQLRVKIQEARLREVEPIPDIIEDAYNHIRQINFLLAFDEELLKPEKSEFRAALFKERSVHQFWLERLGAWDAERVISQIDSFVNERLKGGER